MSLSAIQGGSGAPPEPDWSATLSDVLDLEFARKEWREVVSEMTAAGTLTVANGHMVKRLIDFRVMYERACRDLGENGALGRAKRSRVPQVNPNWTIMRQAGEQVTSLEAELGLSPRRRSAAGRVQRKAKAVRAADEYLKPVAQ